MKGTTEKFTIVGDLQLSVQNALGGINQLQDKLSKLKLPQQNQQDLTSAYKKLQKEAQNYIDIVSRGFKTKQDKKDLNKSFGDIKKYINEWNQAFNSIDPSVLKRAFDDFDGGQIKKSIDLLNELKSQLDNVGKQGADSVRAEFDSVKKSIKQSLDEGLSKGLDPEVYKSKVKELNNIFNSTTKTIAKNISENRFDLLDSNLEKLKTRITNLFEGTGKESQVEDIIKSITTSIDNVDKEGMKQLAESITEVNTQLNNLNVNNLNKVSNTSKQVADSTRDATNAMSDYHSEMEQTADSSIRLNNEMEHLKSRITYFFGLANGVQLFRRALRDAVNTTKELDAVMTQTAVVSKNTVGDMWKTLPEYSKEAKKLGAAIKDVYSAQTLYVQQGLDMNGAMDLGVETLKMARVANIDAAEATNSMTAALRGFNMELTETSALRVNDVYSKLAQNTASNVQEISTAMTKTAALANSANMSFENTAAFLATIIESTREGAETAGTALKTVIARFTEVKKLYSEGELTGTDEEGQEVDVNKISAALRTAGINMNDFFTGAKGLDEIFMELGSKWDSLTTVQQRYIATMAAGSRQQSRFLALMQNYSRTAELTEMAYNSAGSSQEQFEKTLDSLEAKLNQFKAAWDSFVMGIANSDLIKGFIDAGTAILETINKIIDTISGGNGLIKSISSIAAAVGIFKAGKGLASLLIGGVNGKGGTLGSIIGKLFGGKEVGEQATKGFLGSFSSVIKTGTRKNFLSGILKDNFSLYSKASSKIDTSQFQVDLMDTTSNIDFDQYKDSLYAWQDNVAKFGANSKEAASSLKVLEKDFKAAGGSGEEFSKILQQNSTELSSFKVNMNGVANVAGIAGAALLGLGSILEGLGGNWEYVGKIIKAVGVGLLAFTGTYKIVSAATKAFGIKMTATIGSIPIIGWIAIVISALTALSVALASFIETPTEKFERLSTGFEQAAEGAKKTKEDYENLISSSKEIGDAESALNDLVTGTEEWDTAIQNLNQSILELIALYPELAGAITYVNDHLHLDFESDIYKDYVEKQRRAATDAVYAEGASKIGTAKAGLEKETQYNFLGSKEQSLVRLLETGSLYEAMLARVNSDDLYAEQYSSNFYSIDKEAWDLLQKAITDGLLDFSGSLTDVTSQLDTFLRNNNFEYDWDTLDDIRGLLTSSGLGIQYFTKLSNILRGLSDLDSIKTTSSMSARTNLASNFTDTLGSTLAFNMSKELFDKYYNPNIEITLADKTTYANAIGGKVSGKEVYTKEGTKVTEGTQYFVAAKQAEIETKEELTSFYNDIYSKWSSDQQEVFAALFNEGKTLTLQQLKNLNDINFKEYDEIIKKSEEYGGFDENQITKLFANYDKNFEGLNNSTREAIEGFSETIGQAEKFANKANQIQKNGGNIEKIIELFDDSFEGIDAKKVSQAKEILSVTDFGDRTSIRNTIKQLNELGLNIDSNFTKQIINASKAIAKFNLKTLEEQIKSLESGKTAVQRIVEGEKTVSAEEYANLSILLPDFNIVDWVRTGLDEYTYIGEQTNSLLQSIDSAVNQLVAENIEQTKEDISKGLAIQDLITGDKRIYRGRGDAAGIGIEDAIELISQGTANSAVKYQVASALGLSVNTSSEDILKYWNDYYGPEGSSLDSNRQKLAGLQTYAEVGYNQSSAQYLLNQAASGNTAASDALEAQAVNEDLLLKVEDYGKKLGLTTEQINKQKDALNALAITANKTEQNIDNLNEALSKDFQTLKDAKKGTAAYNAAMTNILKTAKKVFGNDITSEWVEQHINDFEDLAKGGDEAQAAFERLSKIKADEVLKKIGNEGILTGDILNTVQAHWNELNGSTLEVGGTADFSDILSGMEVTEEQADALSAYLNSIPGISAVWEPGPDGEVGPNGEIPVKTGRLKITKTGASGSGFSGGGGGGGGGGGEEFKNDFDKYYNMVEDINELERLRNLLETDYNQLLESEAASGKAIYDNLKRQVDLLKERRDITADLAEKRKGQIFDLLNDEEYKDVKQYAWWNEEDQTIEIDWDAINKIKDSETGDKVKGLVQKLEDFQSKYDEQIEALEDIESTLQEIEKRGRDQYTSLEDRVRDALIQQIQTQIDELTAVNEGISDANQKLFDSIQSTLELQRQERDNAKTEEELGDKEQRLAYLQQDSSGANAVEIAQLQKELEDARESYTDQLIDQKISELQKQNDEAAEQRQEQIDLLQQSLDWQEKNGEFWEQAYQLMNNGIGPDGTLVTGSELEQLLKQGEGWQALSQEGKMNWLSELETMVAEAVGYLYLSRQLEKIGTKAGTEITFTDAEGNTHTGKVDKNGNVVIDNGDGTQTVWKDVYQSYDGSYRTFETEKDAKTENKPATGTSAPNSSGDSDGSSGPSGSNTGWEVVDKGTEWRAEYTRKGSLTQSQAENEASKRNSNRKWGVVFTGSQWIAQLTTAGTLSFKEATKKADRLNKDYVTPYATGGLNTKTGPAWLDGTPSHPELVLNARDTENFIQLKDTLADLKKYGTSLGLNGGDNYYDIDVHVDEIGSDYDVDKLADRLRTLIYRDSQYRNVNTLNRLR